MVGELGAPGVQDKCRADAGAEMLAVSGDRARTLGGGIEEKFIQSLLLV
jgi:hypothetical protein